MRFEVIVIVTVKVKVKMEDLGEEKRMMPRILRRERELMFLAVLLAILSAAFLTACSAEQSHLMSTFYNYSS